jgi:hypothetical protein
LPFTIERAEEIWNKAVRFFEAVEKYLVAEEIDGKE